MAVMARVQLIIPDDDRVRFGNQARREGVSLSAWIRVAARERLDRQSKAKRARRNGGVFRGVRHPCRPRVEPDWEQHLAVIGRSRRHGTTDT